MTIGEAPGVFGVDTIDIFAWVELGHHRFGIESFGQRHLDDNSLHRAVVTQLTHRLIELRLADICRQRYQLVPRPHVTTNPPNRPHIAVGRRITRYLHHHQIRGEPQLGDTLFQRLFGGCCRTFSIQH